MAIKNKDEDKILKDGEHVRVPLLFMDSVQRSVGARTPAEAVRATADAMRTQDAAAASVHRPGYRLSTKLMRDSAARDLLGDAYGDYEEFLTNAWKNAAPGPITAAASDDSPLLDKEFDDEADCYAAYDQQIQDAWRTK